MHLNSQFFLFSRSVLFKYKLDYFIPLLKTLLCSYHTQIETFRSFYGLQTSICSDLQPSLSDFISYHSSPYAPLPVTLTFLLTGHAKHRFRVFAFVLSSWKALSPRFPVASSLTSSWYCSQVTFSEMIYLPTQFKTSPSTLLSIISPLPCCFVFFYCTYSL